MSFPVFTFTPGMPVSVRAAQAREQQPARQPEQAQDQQQAHDQEAAS